jgi:lysophospholipase L1-like esterase
MKRIVILGDSHSASLNSPGGVMQRALEAHGFTVTMNAKGGRSAASFMAGEGGAAQLATLAASSPDLVLVFLGTNDIFRDAGKTKIAMTQIRDAFSGTGGTKVWAIGPPYWPAGFHAASAVPPLNTGAASIVALEGSVFTRVIDSRPLTKDIGAEGRSGTGVHFNSAGAKVWGTRLANTVLSAASGLGGGWVFLIGLGAIMIWKRRR